MKKGLAIVAATGVAAISMPAMAQDNDAFTGPRVEALVGWDSSRPGSTEDIDNADDIDQSIDDIAYGVGVGYDFSMGGVVLGIEGEWMESNAKTDFDTTGFTTFGVSNIDTGRDLYVGARAGVLATPQLLLYAKGGYTNGRYNVLATDNTTDTGTKIDADGWRAGAGLEYAISDNLYVKTEYRYSNYTRGEVEAPSGAESDRFDVDLDRHQVVAGVGVRF